MTCARRARAVVFVVLACSGVMHENGALAQHRDRASGLDSPRGPSGRRRDEPARPPAATPPASPPPAAAPPLTGLPLPEEAAAPQSIVALEAVSGSALGAGAHHFEDGDAEEVPWPAPIRAAMPLGGPHFCVELSGGLLAPLLRAQPYAQLLLGIEAFTGELRLRAMVGVAVEELMSETVGFDTRAQGGYAPTVRFSLGGDPTEWLSIRVGAGVGVFFGPSGILPGWDAALQLAVRLTDERRLELGISGGPAFRFVEPFGTYGREALDTAARLGAFVGGVL